MSTKILASLILLKKWPPWYGILILMFQKEVAERIMAKAQTKEYNRRKQFRKKYNCFW